MVEGERERETSERGMGGNEKGGRKTAIEEVGDSDAAAATLSRSLERDKYSQCF